jgi:hypothetical protein
MGDLAMRFLRSALFLAPLLSLLVQGILPRTSSGIPVFARKYSVACTTCHVGFPRLNAFGMAFRQNGYRMPGTKGESPWESKEFPIALIGNVGYTYTSTNTYDAGTNSWNRTAVGGFVQNTVEFHTAGTLAEKISFHFDNNFAGVSGPLNSGVAYLQFDDIVKDGALNVKTGIYDAETPYISESRSTTWTKYLSPIILDGQGIELNGTKSGWTYAAGLINSGRTAGKPTDKTMNQMENSYVWAMRDINGQLVTARVYMDRQNPRVASKSSSMHTQAELNAYLNHGRWILIPGFTYEKFDDADATLYDPLDPTNVANGQRDKIQTGMLEGLVFLDKDSRWMLTARYEQRDMPAFQTLAKQDDQQVVANLCWYANPNARIALEWTHTSDNVKGPKVDGVQAFVHVGY